MRQDTRSSAVGVPAQTLWDYLAEYEHVLQLATAGGKAVLLAGPPRRRGAKYRAWLSWEGIESTYISALADADPPRTLTWSTQAHGTRTSLRLDLEPLGDSSTRVTATLTHSMSRVLRPLEPFGWAMLSKMLDRGLVELNTLGPDQMIA